MVSYLTRLEWFQGQGSAEDAVLITDAVSITVKRGLNSKANKTDLILKNKLVSVTSTSLSVHEYTNSANELQFQQNDIIKVYVKAEDTGDDVIDVGATSLDLLTTSEVEEFGMVYDGRRSQLRVSMMDRTFEVLNNLWAEIFTDSDGKTAPQILQLVIRSVTDGLVGEGFDDSGARVDPGKYSVDARLFSESLVDSGTTTSASSGKLIESGQNFSSTVNKGDMVRNTSTNLYATVLSVDSDTQLTLSKDIMTSGVGYQVGDGFIQDTRLDGTSFPTLSMSKVWRAAFEWAEDISDIRSTNTSGEIDGTIVQDRNMIYNVDHRNRFRWFYPQDDFEYDVTTGAVGSDNSIRIRGMKLVKKTFDILNMVIFNGGEDLDSVGTLNYYYNENTELKRLKMKYVPMLDLSVDLREDEVDNGGITVAADNVVTIVTGFPYTPSWQSTTVADVAAYKSAFRAEIVKRGRRKSRSITNLRANPRWAKQITTNFTNFLPGELLRVTSREYGLQKQLVRIQDVTHQLTPGSFLTTIDLEEDEAKIGEVV